MPDRASIEESFRAGQRRLWGLCYRLTGVAADADELVQEAFVRALEKGPAIEGDDLERWLVRVVTNLSLDCLRRRRRRGYPGPWLPSPVEGDGMATSTRDGGDVADRYERATFVSYAFLVALEALGPRARAVLLLREVLEYPVEDVARVLDTSQANVRVLHHRARRRLEGQVATAQPTAALVDAQRTALTRLTLCFLQQDVVGMEALLTQDVRSLTDGGGVFTALRAPLVGRLSVARFHLETARRRAPFSRSEIRMINGLPALVVETTTSRPRMAPRLVLRVEIDAEGRIAELHTILAPRKLTGVRFDPPAGA